MKKLVIFGDSFGCGEYKHHSVWPAVLGKKLGVDVQNYANSGTSVEYSICKLLQYLESDVYDKNDIMVFIQSVADRFLVNESLTDLTFARNIGIVNNRAPTTGSAAEYYEKNKEHFKWLTESTPPLVLAARYEAYLAYLRFLGHQFFSKVVIIPTFCDQHTTKYNKKLLSDNIVTVITQDLCELSDSECVDIDVLRKSHHDLRFDVRPGHFITENHSILAENMFRIITLGEIEFTIPFIKNVIISNNIASNWKKVYLPLLDPYFINTANRYFAEYNVAYHDPT